MTDSMWADGSDGRWLISWPRTCWNETPAGAELSSLIRIAEESWRRGGGKVHRINTCSGDYTMHLSVAALGRCPEVPDLMPAGFADQVRRKESAGGGLSG